MSFGGPTPILVYPKKHLWLWSIRALRSLNVHPTISQQSWIRMFSWDFLDQIHRGGSVRPTDLTFAIRTHYWRFCECIRQIKWQSECSLSTRINKKIFVILFLQLLKKKLHKCCYVILIITFAFYTVVCSIVFQLSGQELCERSFFD